MASQGYRDWLSAGRPYTLIRPAKAVQATLRGYGLTVYDYPNDTHLQAAPPEDHTPFSVTGWPGQNRRWKARALDVMPRADSAAARNENAAIARQLIRDRDAGVPGAMWIKYINWTDEFGICRQERWTNAAAPLQRATKVSSDRGHIHISGRSDVDDDTRADEYDPIARLQGKEYSVSDSALIDNAERGVTALIAGTDPIQFDYPWNDQAAKGFPNPLVRLEKKVDALLAAAAADETRDRAVAAAIAAAGGDVDAVPIIAAIHAVADQVHADVEQLQQRLAAAEAHNVQLAAALAAAGAQLQAADDPAV
jgi:hypothetical protein